MFRLLTVALIVFVSGCKTGGSDVIDTCYTSYSHPQDVYGETGVVLKATTPEVTFVTFPEMEQIYTDVEMCVVDTNTPGPFVEFRSFNHLGLNGGWGVYAASTQTMYINTDEDLVERNCHSDRATLKHEFVHHILYMNGQDRSHANEAFARCEALGAKTCNGVACE